ncbi:MAG: hypothetical protein M1825_005655 [Sarcosagium campestre]|nr:MAG: hypothetical protein M1825_005655 [Sarcosagium campestre]
MISGHTETIQLLLREGANPNQRTRDAEPLFHILARLSPTIIGYEDAFESGADINIKNGSQLSCLHVAVRYDREEITRWLLEKGANLEAKDIQGRTSMHIAARYSKVKIIKLLARHNADLEPFDDAFWFPIHHAVCYDRIPAVRYFIDRTYGGKELYRGPGPRYGGLEDTADATLTEKTVGSTLHLAAYHGHAEIIRALLSHGANIEARDEDGMTPLLVASQMGQYTALAHLVRHGANVNSQSNAKITALHIAVSKNLVEITKQLLDAKVDVDACDLMRQTPLHKAVCNLNNAFDGQATIIKLLLSCGADPLKRDIRGAIPLHYLGRENFWDNPLVKDLQHTNLRRSYFLAIHALTNNNASVNTQDEWGMTPLHWTAGKSSLMSDMLLDIGADVHCADRAGNTPLHWALLQIEKTWDQERRTGRTACHHVVEELMERGAKVDCRNGHKETPYDIYMRVIARSSQGEVVNPMDYPFSVGIERQHERDIGEELDPAESNIDYLKRALKERNLEVQTWI